MAGSLNKFGVSSLNRDGVVRADWPCCANIFRASMTKPDAMNLAYWLVIAALGSDHELVKQMRPFVRDDDATSEFPKEGSN
jgi:hypothetical protein